ncbi:lysozyme inhibitor LprI family protein [Phenylobacterium sp.]|uniref:lysozyme inhibitor LprI family protein n=1 Tax=Phenylobacterium sp. TaxID=1871053 RepID=UPI0035AF16C4
MDRGKTKGVVIAFALALASCGKSEVKLADANPIALISSGDAKACAHPDVLKVLEGLIGTPKGDEAGLILPVGAVEISKMTLPPFTVDMITLASVDMSVKRLTCRATSKMSADIGGPTQHFEKEIVYVVSPSAADDKEFIVSTDASIAADRVNIAIVKEIARGVRQAQADDAAQQRLKAALESAGATKPVKAIVPASAEKEAASSADVEESYSAEYNRCMDASGGVTVEMRDCNDAEYVRQDARLNAAYKAAMAVRDESQKVALRNAQRTWIKHRDAKCQENLEGGTMDLLLVDSCHLSMTMKRAAELEGMTTGQ